MGIYRKEYTQIKQDEFTKGDLVEITSGKEALTGVFLSCFTLRIYDKVTGELLSGYKETPFYCVIEQKSQRKQEVARNLIRLVQSVQSTNKKS